MTKIKDQGSNRGKTSDTADFDCNECHGTGMVKRYIGHEGRGAIFPCTCARGVKNNLAALSVLRNF
jgi:hypothetical protein